jgi:hypothetical protein
VNKFLSVFKNIIPFVVGTEAALGDSVPGATKKQLVLQMLHGAAGVGEAIPVPMVAEISGLIDVAVSVFLKPKPTVNGSGSTSAPVK